MIIGIQITAPDTPWPAFREETGQLPDGTEYIIRVPENWNSVLIRDLDFASGGSLIRSGWAGSVIWRHEATLLPGQRVIAYANGNTARHVRSLTTTTCWICSRAPTTPPNVSYSADAQVADIWA